MSESRVQLRRKQRLIAENPYCCLCGGMVLSVSEDHIPPKGCFPPGKHPEGMEFPACLSCNQSTRKYDAIFGFYAMALDFNEDNIDADVFSRKIKGMLNNFDYALPRLNGTANQKRKALKRFGMQREPGQLLSEIGIFKPDSDVLHSINIVIRKTACALFFKETGKILPFGHGITGGWHQLQDIKRDPILQYLNNSLPEYREPRRKSVRNYGKRFRYKFGYMDRERFFAFIAQIGDGIVIYGMTIAPDTDPPAPWILPVWRVGDPWLPITTACNGRH